MDPKWLEWAKQLQAIAQSGLTYAKDVYDIERYEAIRQLGVDILSTYSTLEPEQAKLVFANDTGYATPKTDVRAVVFRDGRLLMVREKLDGAWALPGGWADIGYSPTEVAVKEVREESGYAVIPLRLLAVLDKKFHEHPPSPHHVYKLFIACKIVGGEAASGIETSDVAFFAEDELPGIGLSVERNTLSQLQAMFEFHRHPRKRVMLD